MKNHLLKSTLFQITFASTIVVLNCSSPAFSWGGFVHQVIARDAYFAIKGIDFPKQGDKSPDYYWLGVLVPYTQEPDKYNSSVNHLSASTCAWKLESLASACIKAMKKNEDWEAVMQDLGRATHFIQDMNCPHHGIEKYIPGGHEGFERKAVFGFWNNEKSDGFHLIADYDYFVYNAAGFSRRFIKYDTDEFYNNHDFYKKVMEPLWDHVVNDVLDFWLTVFYRGLGEERYLEIGFPPKVGSRDENKTSFPDLDIRKD
jgi:hypothetical protein